MRRRDIIGFLGSAVVAFPLAVRAQQLKRIPRIGLFLSAPRNSNVDEFLGGLRDLGWIEGESIHIEYRSAGGDDNRLSELAVELVTLKVDVLVTASTGVYAAHRATTIIPIVAISTGDIVAMGLAASLAHPGGNITGQTFFAPELVAKRLEILKAVAPSATRVAVLMVKGVPTNAHVMSVVEAAAKKMSVELRPVELGGIDELARAFSIAGFAPLDGVVMTDHPLLLTNAAMVATFAGERGLPAIGAPIIATHGGLIGYGVDFPLMFRRAAVFVDKILKGANPGDIPIEQATKFKTIVNLKSAKALRVEIPPTLLAGADEVIE